MLKRFQISGLVISLLTTAAMADSPAELRAVMVPLDQVWAYQMPGTRALSASQSGSGEFTSQHGAVLRDILHTLDRKPDKEAGPAFAVNGTGMDALNQARSAMLGKLSLSKEIAEGSPISVVFFSHEFNRYVHIHKVVRDRREIRIHYDFVPHFTKEMTEHFALVPLGRLPIGDYAIQIVQSPIDHKFDRLGIQSVDPSISSRVVCRSSTFSVIENDKQGDAKHEQN